MMTMGQTVLPHWMLRVATNSGATRSMAQMEKLEGFQMWRPRYAERIF